MPRESILVQSQITGGYRPTGGPSEPPRAVPSQPSSVSPPSDPRDRLLLDLMDTLTRLLVYRDEDAARDHFNMARDRWRKSREVARER